MIFDDWSGWLGCCRHCNRGVSICGKLDKRGFCVWCKDQGRDSLYSDQPSITIPEKRNKRNEVQ